jgi:hypothetical protein
MSQEFPPKLGGCYIVWIRGFLQVDEKKMFQPQRMIQKFRQEMIQALSGYRFNKSSAGS